VRRDRDDGSEENDQDLRARLGLELARATLARELAVYDERELHRAAAEIAAALAVEDEAGGEASFRVRDENLVSALVANDQELAETWPALAEAVRRVAERDFAGERAEARAPAPVSDGARVVLRTRDGDVVGSVVGLHDEDRWIVQLDLQYRSARALGDEDVVPRAEFPAGVRCARSSDMRRATLRESRDSVAEMFALAMFSRICESPPDLASEDWTFVRTEITTAMAEDDPLGIDATLLGEHDLGALLGAFLGAGEGHEDLLETFANTSSVLRRLAESAAAVARSESPDEDDDRGRFS
jgi:hypothetical protein